jgi:hypothetical protein
MKTFKLKVVYTFEGTVDVQADNLEQAKDKVGMCSGLTAGNFHTSDDNIVDWEIMTHPVNTKITLLKK